MFRHTSSSLDRSKRNHSLNTSNPRRSIKNSTGIAMSHSLWRSHLVEVGREPALTATPCRRRTTWQWAVLVQTMQDIPRLVRYWSRTTVHTNPSHQCHPQS